jgi:hypothetical protein
MPVEGKSEIHRGGQRFPTGLRQLGCLLKKRFAFFWQTWYASESEMS